MSKIRLADYIMATLADSGVNTAFMVTGGFAMYLNDALAGEKRIHKIIHHHEQGAAYAAEGYGHLTGRPALVQVTAGPGAINAMSGVFGAFVDSIPMIVISGQNRREISKNYYNLNEVRHLGDQDADIINIVAPITKYARRVDQPERIAFELGKAIHLASAGRPGPVWLEIPLDIQDSLIEPEQLCMYRPGEVPCPDLTSTMHDLLDKFNNAARPLLVVGPDVRKPGLAELFRNCAEHLGMPIVCAGAQDTISGEHPLFAGKLGTLGTRAGNIAVQNADCILFIGMRPYLGLVTFNWQSMGKNAFKIVVDEDPSEFDKPCQIAAQGIICEQEYFLKALLKAAENFDSARLLNWRNFCRERLRLLPPVTDNMRTVSENGRVNPYWFSEELFKLAGKDDIFVASNGSSSVIPQQAGELKNGQRYFSNHGNGAMGFSLPASIGAAVAGDGKRVICIEGDGSIMMNIQELQTIVHHRLPIIIVVFNNDGYISIKQTQKNYFQRTIGSDPGSGLSLPDFTKVAESFGIQGIRISGRDFSKTLKNALASRGPLLIEAILDPAQGFEPKVASRRLPDGSMQASSPEDMFPFLSQEELARHLLPEAQGWQVGKDS